MYQKSTESQKHLETQLSELKFEQQPSPEKFVKLADFTIFLMKLMQRLESQTHSNISENPNFTDKVSDSKYVKGRQNHMEMKLPRTPEDFLDQI